MSGLAAFLLVLAAAIGLISFILWRWFGRGVGDWIRTQWGGALDPEVVDNIPPFRPAPLYPADIDPERNRPRIRKALFIAAIVVYLLAHFIGLERFPIYFFADEAAQTVLAADLVRDGFQHEGVFLPTYFYNVDKYSLGVTVYLQVIPYLLFGKSILVTRGAAVLAAALGAAAVGLLLRDLFGYPYGWVGVLLLGLSPAWFIHSRTAFETAVAAAFFAVFLYAYLRYLHGSPNYIPLAGFAAALTFYSYNPARVVILAAVGLLTILDLRVHWANRRRLLRYSWLAVLVIPYLRFQLEHPFAAVDQLYLLNSYWVQPISFLDKMWLFGQEYLRGISPLYWYFPHEQDIVRHVMRGYGHLLWITLPFALVGLLYTAKNLRQPSYRAVLVVLFCAPLGGALVETFVTRSLFVVIPASLLTGIGLARVHAWLAVRIRRGWALPAGLFIILAAGNLLLLRAALLDGPMWFEDYGLYGMQYGAAQVFSAVAEEAAADPDLEFVISPHWTHGLSMLVRFFLEDPVPVVWGVVDDYLEFDYPLDEAAVYVMLPDEYERALASPRLARIEVERMILFPNGEPGFYFTKIYTDYP
jgi:hypothetical protein